MKQVFAILLLLFAVTAETTAQTTCQLRTFTVRDGLPANNISGLDQDRRGLLWIATWNGLCCYDGYQFTTFRGDGSDGGDMLSTKRLAQICCDSQGHVWVRTYDKGLYLFDTHTCRFVNMGARLKKHFGKDVTPRNFYALKNGHTWITDEQNNMNLRVDDSHPEDITRMAVYGAAGTPLYGTFMRKAMLDSKGREWLVTDRGMMRYGSKDVRHKTDATQRCNTLPAGMGPLLAAAGIDTTSITKFLQDRQGNLWYCSAKGLSLVNFYKQRIHDVALVAAQQTRSVVCRRDGTVWAGTQDGKLAVIRPGQGVERVMPFANRIYALFEDSKGRLWIGTKGEGAYLVKSGEIRARSEAQRVDVGSLQVYDFDEDHDGNLWVATFDAGLKRLDGNTLQLLPTAYPKEGFEKVRRVTHDRLGAVYASTTTGLVVMKPAKGKDATVTIYRHEEDNNKSLLSSDVMQTIVNRTDDVFVSTLGGGMQQLVDGGWKTIPTTGGGNILSLTEDRHGSIWIVHEGGIERYQPTTKQMLNNGPNLLPENIEPTEAKPALDPDGRLWIGTLGKVQYVNTNEMQQSGYQPNVLFTSVSYQDQREALPLLNIPKLVVGKTQRNLAVTFAALDYQDKYLIQYAYRLVRTDRVISHQDEEAWNYIGHTPRIAFSELAPGNYVLAVRSTNSDGVWCDNEAQLAINVVPTFLERTWVRVLLVLLAIALSTWAVLSWLAYRRRQREREQRLERLMQQYRELQEQLNNEGPSPQFRLSEPDIVDPDEEMMNRLMAFLEQHISDEDLKIEQMAEAVNMGRTVFYEKIRTLVGVSPIDFLRQMRMQRARQLIAKSKMSISEVAYAVGFTDPKYFTKCFKKETGMTPSEYRSKEPSAVD